MCKDEVTFISHLGNIIVVPASSAVNLLHIYFSLSNGTNSLVKSIIAPL